MQKRVGLVLVGILSGCGGSSTPADPSLDAAPTVPGDAASGGTAASPSNSANVTVVATNVSSLSGGEALAFDKSSGDLIVKSLQDPLGAPIQLARLSSGSVSSVVTL